MNVDVETQDVSDQMSRVQTKRFPAYSKIFALGTRHTEDILQSGEIQITEKVDGSQFAFGKLDGRVRCRSKGQEIHMEAPDKMFEEGVNYVQSIAHVLVEGCVYYCEYLRKPKHNTLAYDRIPTNHLALFAMSFNDVFSTRHEYLTMVAEGILDIEVVPLVYEGPAIDVSPEDVLAMIDRKSFLGSQNIEGVVIKNFRERLVGGQLIPVQSAKYVSEAFKEVHRENWSAENTSGGKWQAFKDSYRTTARWNKAVEHLRDAGKLQRAPQDIGALIKEVREDITAEEKEIIKDKLWKEFSGDLIRRATAGLPEWYKEKLVLEMVDQDPTVSGED